jgi:hypothetical protein
VAVSGGRVFAGGGFSSVGGRPRRGLAAVDVRGRLLAWAPALPASARAVGLSAAGGTVFARVSSSSGSTNTQFANRLLAYSVTSGRPTGFAWDPPPKTTISALAATPTTLYVAGIQVDEGATIVAEKPFVGALDAQTGHDLAPRVFLRGGEFPLGEALAVGNDVLYVGGEFTHIGNARRRNFAAFGLRDLHVSALAPNPEFTVSSMAVARHAVYLADQEIVTVRTSAAPAARIHVGPDDDARLLASVKGRLYAAGLLTGRDGEEQNVAEFSQPTGRPTRWNPRVNDFITALATAPDGTVVLGGRFTVAGGVAQRGLAIFRPHSRPR